MAVFSSSPIHKSPMIHSPRNRERHQKQKFRALGQILCYQTSTSPCKTSQMQMLVKRTPTSERHSRGTRNKMDLSSIQSSRNGNTNTPAPLKLFNELLQACYQIDSTLCTSTQTHANEILSWQSLDPYQYLTSPSLLKRWETDLELLSHQYLTGYYTPDTFEEKLASILPGVERFEEAKRMMELNFEDELENCGVDIVVPERFWEAIEERCRIIDDAFKGLERRLDEQNEVAASS